MNNFILKGDIIYFSSKKELICRPNSFLVVESGLSLGVYDEIPSEFKDYKLIDYTGKLITPGFNDLHLHAGQYQFRGNGMDLELMDWLEAYAFKEECKFKNLEYADKAYDIFVSDLKNGFTTRASIFATLHKDATLLLMEKLEKSGLQTYVGLVEMDRNSPDYLRQESVEVALKDTEEYILESDKFNNTFPIITPRFTPTCTKELMEGISKLREKYSLTVQSHLDENPSEIAFVKELEPESLHYSDAYDKYKMFGNDYKCIMAHCIYNNEDEIKLLKERDIYVAHCPESNMNVTSGIAPVARYLDEGIHTGLGSDVSGGSSLSLIRAARQAIQVSKLYYRYVSKEARLLNVKDAFYMLTLGGGKFFGEVGSFDAGYEFDCLVIDDLKTPCLLDMNLLQRLERFIYIGDESMLVDKYVLGNKINIDK